MSVKEFRLHVERLYLAGIITESKKNKRLKQYQYQINKDQKIYVHVSEIYLLEKHDNS
tara:strand:+ start:169 stop:342 length:174 start_codon:yes stop_codon:yes gene_type:complete